MKEEKIKQSHASVRVIADHIRTVTVSLCDGAPPSNKGRGSTLKSILAIRICTYVL